MLYLKQVIMLGKLMLIPFVRYSRLIAVLLEKIIQISAELQRDRGHHPPEHPAHVWKGGCDESNPLGMHLTCMVLM